MELLAFFGVGLNVTIWIKIVRLAVSSYRRARPSCMTFWGNCHFPPLWCLHGSVAERSPFLKLCNLSCVLASTRSQSSTSWRICRAAACDWTVTRKRAAGGDTLWETSVETSLRSLTVTVFSHVRNVSSLRLHNITSRALTLQCLWQDNGRGTYSGYFSINTDFFTRYCNSESFMHCHFVY